MIYNYTYIYIWYFSSKNFKLSNTKQHLLNNILRN